MFKRIKINSKRLQEPKNHSVTDWYIYYKSFNKYEFRTFHERLNLKFPTNTMDAKCIDGAWYWIIEENK